MIHINREKDKRSKAVLCISYLAKIQVIIGIIKFCRNNYTKKPNQQGKTKFIMLSIILKQNPKYQELFNVEI